MLNINRSNFQAHPFHLVSPSPWPLYTSISLLSLTTSAVLSFHGFAYAENNLLLSLICLVLSMSLWFRDIIAEGTYMGNHTLAVQRGLNIGVGLFIVSEALFGYPWAVLHLLSDYLRILKDKSAFLGWELDNLPKPHAFANLPLQSNSSSLRVAMDELIYLIDVLREQTQKYNGLREIGKAADSGQRINSDQLSIWYLARYDRDGNIRHELSMSPSILAIEKANRQNTFEALKLAEQLARLRNRSKLNIMPILPTPLLSITIIPLFKHIIYYFRLIIPHLGLFSVIVFFIFNFEYFLGINKFLLDNFGIYYAILYSIISSLLPSILFFNRCRKVLKNGDKIINFMVNYKYPYVIICFIVVLIIIILVFYYGAFFYVI